MRETSLFKSNLVEARLLACALGAKPSDLGLKSKCLVAEASLLGLSTELLLRSVSFLKSTAIAILGAQVVRGSRSAEGKAIVGVVAREAEVGELYAGVRSGRIQEDVLGLRTALR